MNQKLEELKSNEESETFFRVPDPSTEGRLRRKYPRMWTMIGLNQVDIVTHPHAQYVSFSKSFWRNLCKDSYLEADKIK